jgi:hypothetical protein
VLACHADAEAPAEVATPVAASIGRRLDKHSYDDSLGGATKLVLPAAGNQVSARSARRTRLLAADSSAAHAAAGQTVVDHLHGSASAAGLESQLHTHHVRRRKGAAARLPVLADADKASRASMPELHSQPTLSREASKAVSTRARYTAARDVRSAAAARQGLR